MYAKNTFTLNISHGKTTISAKVCKFWTENFHLYADILIYTFVFSSTIYMHIIQMYVCVIMDIHMYVSGQIYTLFPMNVYKVFCMQDRVRIKSL